ncbi:MAG: tRNA 2-thiouridine(34) synthase MnmA [Holosporales bacterium]|jgi:tRNA-specific 2-thiouridylase|nr:tRNA 2-thiouridine(34) synthase MnmA [Holosporales bacterium]
MQLPARNNPSKEKKTYAIAMSGGVDSSVVASMLQRAGHNVFGITMDIHENCVQDIEDAQSVCKILGIQHEVFNVRAEYKAKVIDLFADYYARGLTPNPCALCNRDLKLNILVDYARTRGADFLATGHYANLEILDGEEVILSEAANLSKDQTYFVSLAPKEKLIYVQFPLGGIKNKSETRSLAAEYGLPNFEKDESQDICFIKQGSYKEFLQNLETNLNLFSPGRIRLKDTGKIIGCHSGIANYTIGQRKGLGISSDRGPLYVLDVDSDNNDIIVGNKAALDVREFLITDVNWLTKIQDEFVAFVKLRSFSKKTKSVITILEGLKSIKIKLLEESMTPITRGQICAIYSDTNTVICAGIIS